MCMSIVAGFLVACLQFQLTEQFGVHVKCHNFVCVTGSCVFSLPRLEPPRTQECADNHDTAGSCNGGFLGRQSPLSALPWPANRWC